MGELLDNRNKKSIGLIVLFSIWMVFFMSASALAGKWVAFDKLKSGQGKKIGQLQQKTKKVHIQTPISNLQELVVDYEVPGMDVVETEENGTVYQILSMEGEGFIHNVGTPQLPMIGRYVAVPQDADVTVEVVESSFTEMDGFWVYPAQDRVLDAAADSDQPFRVDEALYQQNEYYPTKVVDYDGPYKMRGCSVIILRYHPVQFNPAEKKLKVYSTIRVKVSFSGGKRNFVKNRYRSKVFDKLFNKFLLNNLTVKSSKVIKQPF